MTEDRKPLPESDLDALFAAARAAEPAPLEPDFAARLIAQAEAARPRPVPARPGWLHRLRAALADVGGAPGLAGLSAAGVAGLWIGLADPVGAATYVLQGAGLAEAATPFDHFADF
jgi:hypothetical protein